MLGAIAMVLVAGCQLQSTSGQMLDLRDALPSRAMKGGGPIEITDRRKVQAVPHRVGLTRDVQKINRIPVRMSNP